MKLLGRVGEPLGADGAAPTIQIAPEGRRFETVGKQPPVGSFVVFDTEIATVTDEELADWFGWNDLQIQGGAYREAELRDFLDAGNADAFVAAIPAAFAVDAIERFANEQGLSIVNAIRAALDEDPTRAAAIAARAVRFARIVGATDAESVLGELAALHDVEHLLGLEHAIGRWVAGAAHARTAELRELGKRLPSDAISAGISPIWYRWWWQLARGCSRSALAHVVDQVVAAADDACGDQSALNARTEAHRLAQQMRSARRAELWAGLPLNVHPSTLVRDEADAHYCAFKAVSHAAHAVAHALVDTVGVPYADASRRAMRQLADVAIRAALAQ